MVNERIDKIIVYARTRAADTENKKLRFITKKLILSTLPLMNGSLQKKTEKTTGIIN